MTDDEKLQGMSRALAGGHALHPFTRRIEELTNSLCAAEVLLAELGYRQCKLCKKYKPSTRADRDDHCNECHGALSCNDCGRPITDHTEVYIGDANGLVCPKPAPPKLSPHE